MVGMGQSGLRKPDLGKLSRRNLRKTPGGFAGQLNSQSAKTPLYRVVIDDSRDSSLSR